MLVFTASFQQKRTIYSDAAELLGLRSSRFVLPGQRKKTPTQVDFHPSRRPPLAMPQSRCSSLSRRHAGWVANDPGSFFFKKIIHKKTSTYKIMRGGTAFAIDRVRIGRSLALLKLNSLRHGEGRFDGDDCCGDCANRV
jgi:hypothetical protein